MQLARVSELKADAAVFGREGTMMQLARVSELKEI